MQHRQFEFCRYVLVLKCDELMELNRQMYGYIATIIIALNRFGGHSINKIVFELFSLAFCQILSSFVNILQSS